MNVRMMIGAGSAMLLLAACGGRAPKEAAPEANIAVPEVSAVVETNAMDAVIADNAVMDNAAGDNASNVGDRTIGDRTIGDRTIGDRTIGDR